MQCKHWFNRAVRFGLVGIVALSGAAAFAQDKENKKTDEAKPASKAEDGAQFDIRVPENAPGRHARGPRPSEYWLGLEAYPMQDALRSQLDLPEGQGLVIEQVMPDSPAAKAGLKRHDVLLSLNDKPLKDVPDLVSLIAENKDKEVTLQVFRKGKNMNISVSPAKRPEGPLPEPPGGDQRFMRRLFDQMTERGGGEPTVMRFFHPGMLLPPGAQGRKFPDDLTIIITKQGDKPASVEVKQGDQTWKATTDDLAALPENVRGFAEELLGRWPGNISFHVQGPGGAWSATPPPGPPVPPPGELGRGGQLRERAEERLEKQFDEMHRRLQELREEMNDLRNRRGPRPDDRQDRPNPRRKSAPDSRDRRYSRTD